MFRFPIECLLEAIMIYTRDITALHCDIKKVSLLEIKILPILPFDDQVYKFEGVVSTYKHFIVDFKMNIRSMHAIKKQSKL